MSSLSLDFSFDLEKQKDSQVLIDEIRLVDTKADKELCEKVLLCLETGDVKSLENIILLHPDILNKIELPHKKPLLIFLLEKRPINLLTLTEILILKGKNLAFEYDINGITPLVAAINLNNSTDFQYEEQRYLIELMITLEPKMLFLGCKGKYSDEIAKHTKSPFAKRIHWLIQSKKEKLEQQFLEERKKELIHLMENIISTATISELELILDRNPKVLDLHNEKGETALTYLLGKGKTQDRKLVFEKFRLLVSKKPSLLTQRENDLDRTFPLIIAIREGCFQEIDFILEQAPGSVKMSFGSGITPLMLAAFFGHENYVRKILSIDPSNILMRTENDKTAADVARLPLDNTESSDSLSSALDGKKKEIAIFLEQFRQKIEQELIERAERELKAISDRMDSEPLAGQSETELKNRSEVIHLWQRSVEIAQAQAGVALLMSSVKRTFSQLNESAQHDSHETEDINQGENQDGNPISPKNKKRRL